MKGFASEWLARGQISVEQATHAKFLSYDAKRVVANVEAKELKTSKQDPRLAPLGDGIDILILSDS